MHDKIKGLEALMRPHQGLRETSKFQSPYALDHSASGAIQQRSLGAGNVHL